MQNSSKPVQLIAIPFVALLSVIFGLLLVSFPVGIFVVFESEIGRDINYEYPLTNLQLFDGTVLQQMQIDISIGDAFVVLWVFYLAIFVIAVLGPKQEFLKAISVTVSQKRFNTRLNYMIGVTKWFSIIVLASTLIDMVQTAVLGIRITPPDVDNHLFQFFYISLAPLIEEFGFRLVLIGVPLFMIYSKRMSVKYFIRCLWNPNTLDAGSSAKAVVLIIFVGIIFGFAHIATGEAWSEGKFAQAAMSGIILGWVYYRYGFVAALLIHWATNYFVFAYGYFIAEINSISIESAFSHSFMSTIETILLASGAFSLCVLFANRFFSRKISNSRI